MATKRKRLRRRIFIVEPVANEGWKVCLHDGRTSITECYERKAYKEVAYADDIKKAFKEARRHGAKRPRII